MTMTQQKIFDKVAAGLLKQGKPAFADHCHYKTKTGERCAIGMLLTEKQLAWAKNINGGIQSLIEKSKEDNVKLPTFISSGEYLDFLIDLQCAHDGPCCNSSRSWKLLWINRMKGIASDYELDASI